MSQDPGRDIDVGAGLQEVALGEAEPLFELGKPAVVYLQQAICGGGGDGRRVASGFNNGDPGQQVWVDVVARTADREAPGPRRRSLLLLCTLGGGMN